MGTESYDNPAYPWLTAGKATVMSDAVMTALPDDVTVALSAPSASFRFDPVEDFGGEGDPMTYASGEVRRGDTSAFMSVNVGPTLEGVPACVAGSLDRRESRDDGTVVDNLDTWYEIDGARTYSRTVTAYRTDGTRVSAYLSGGASPDFPLDVDELGEVATRPELAVSFVAPAGSPPPEPDCVVMASDNSTVADIRPEALDALNAAFDAVWSSIPSAPTLDRPVGSLRPSGYGSGVCADFVVLGTPTDLSLTVVGGQPLPTAPDPYDPNFYGQLPETRSLPDGSVVQFYDIDITETPVGEDGSMRLMRSVTVTRPSGVQVTARSTIDAGANGPAPLQLPQPLSAALLDALANAPVGQWP
jgi:hypothetical protein